MECEQGRDREGVERGRSAWMAGSMSVEGEGKECDFGGRERV